MPAAATKTDIPFQDLVGHHRPIEEELAAALARVIRSGHFVAGPEVAHFEREAASALGVMHAVGVSSGT
ncbi:MAG TPA: DegT/DnrJ/EryC1/StrS family aminotransferase, partial [Polyangia bacterium]|nr:DegT/DnrJ/EryC1/StrS family aminotransferase [Polyangia bacterium]